MIGFVNEIVPAERVPLVAVVSVPEKKVPARFPIETILVS
jgi:hypothetical protein